MDKVREVWKNCFIQLNSKATAEHMKENLLKIEGCRDVCMSPTIPGYDSSSSKWTITWQQIKE